MTKTISKKKTCKKGKWLSEETLQIAAKRREVKGKGETERNIQMNSELWRIARRDKKAFLGQTKKGKTVKLERLELSKKIEDTKVISPFYGKSNKQFQWKFNSVAQSCQTLCDTMDCSTPSFPVHHQLQELAQTHVHPVGDAIQPFQPLSSPSPAAFNLSQNQGLFQ